MSDDRERVTVRLPEEAYERVCEELPSFSTDTTRFQYLVQFYFDSRDRHAPGCNTEAHGPNAPARGEHRPPLHEYSSSESESESRSQSESESQPESESQSDSAETNPENKTVSAGTSQDVTE